MEFVWSGGATGHVHANQSSILAHVLDRHYSSPQGMDFERDPPIADEEDLTKRAESLVKELRDVSRGYPSRSVMMQLAGDDFKWLNASAQVSDHSLAYAFYFVVSLSCNPFTITILISLRTGSW